ncbi:MAG: exodeoxyribonuclease VII small subunit [Acinetobacter sp.]|jgi:exodeoxyribonuclease VII small subunit|nr:exodeoxyribonuclease VII small subunit [Acinetobacter sp.]
MTKNKLSEISNISFESAVRELEAIVNQMETNQLPLQDALNAFKHGTALLQQCQKTLADVEQQVRILSDENQLQNHQDKQE